MSEIMKIKDERERGKNKDKIERRCDTSYSDSVRAKWFCFVLKLGLVQLMYKASLMFKWNLEFKRKLKLKERIMPVKPCCGGVYMFQNMRLVILFDKFLNPSFKIMTNFANVGRTAASSRRFIY